MIDTQVIWYANDLHWYTIDVIIMQIIFLADSVAPSPFLAGRQPGAYVNLTVILEYGGRALF